MKSEKGFTLLTLVMGVVIMGLLAVTAGNFMGNTANRRMKIVTKDRIKNIITAIYGNTNISPQVDYGYVADLGVIPNSLEDLIYDNGDLNWNGPYLIPQYDNYSFEDQLKDAYGNPLVYDNINGAVKIANESLLNIEKKFEFSPYSLENSYLWGNIRDIDNNIPNLSDLGNIVITLTYTVDFDAAIPTSTSTSEKKGGNPFKTNPPLEDTFYGRIYTVNPSADGTYRFDNIPVGDYIVQASHDLLGIMYNKPVIIHPDYNNRTDFKFNLIFPGYPGYGAGTQGNKLIVSYTDLIIDGGSDNDLRLGNSDELNPVTIDKIQINWSNSTIFEKMQKIVIGNTIVYDKTGGLGSGTKAGDISGTIIDIADFTIQPMETGKILELYWNMDVSPKSLELKFILLDLTEVIVPDVISGGTVINESDFLIINTPDLVLNSNFDEDISLGNSNAVNNIVLDQIELTWANATGAEKINQVIINGSSVWSGNSTSGKLLNIIDYTIPPTANNIVLRFEFSKNISNKNISNITFYMSDGTTKSNP